MRFAVRYRHAAGEGAATVFALDAADAQALAEDHGVEVVEVLAVPEAPTACVACGQAFEGGEPSLASPGHCPRCAPELEVGTGQRS